MSLVHSGPEAGKKSPDVRTKARLNDAYDNTVKGDFTELTFYFNSQTLDFK